jgi:hypothetical protein
MPQPWWRISVIEQLTWTANERIFGGGNANAGLLYQATATPQIFLFDGAQAAGNTNAVLNTRVVVSEFHSGASSTLQVNNGTASTGNPGTTAPGGFTSFSQHTGALPSNVRIYAVAMGSGAPPYNTSDIKNYLAKTYGVSL